jgi:ribonuclease HII
MRRERSLRRRGFQKIAGVDEAGRGPLAGPVVAAACLFPPKVTVEGVDDSKKLSPQRRNELHEKLRASGISIGVGVVDAAEIDRINIFQATIKAMQAAVDQLNEKPDYLLVDGLQLPYPTVPVEKVIRGDQLCHAIAAASIVAKEVRDRMMEAFDLEYPEYGFARHKGYGTEAHREALRIHGPSPIHRRSFSWGSS